ncbi:MAG: hypothetical protein KBB54_02125 [Candidatus Pacebacteria bacterium]|nr:hypothetical protein [Candidatus Paceibacterota bacterium]MBP9818468.1 hypothetical protein [Candidatus Paceibacterota bacterium]
MKLLKTYLQKGVEFFEKVDRFNLLGYLTLFMLLFFGPNEWFLLPIYQIALLLSLLFSQMLRSPVLWGTLSFVTFVALFDFWEIVDNHMWLILYWLLVLFLTTLSSRMYKTDILDFVKHNAIFMMVFIMGVSVLQKIVGGVFMDGSFFEFTILTDERFYLIAHYLGGISTFDFFNNVDMLSNLSDPHSPLVIKTSNAVRTVSLIFTYSIVLLEICIATLFLVKNRKARLWAHILNALFIITVYFVAPVYAFAFLIAVLAIATLDTDRSSSRLLLMYFALLILIFLYKIPWFSLVVYFANV